MRPIRVSHLGLALVGLVLIAVLGLGSLMWLELGQLTSRLHVQEQESARIEVNDGLTRLESNLLDTAQSLARWDETRQQLVYPEYYAMWRDLRVRDAGMVSANVVGVALYDKTGRILGVPRGASMPERLTGAPVRRTRFAGAGDACNLLVLFPVHADPEGAMLLGYGAIKVDLISQLRMIRAYRYADSASFNLRLTTGPTESLGKSIAALDYKVAPNRELANIREILQVAFMRLLAALLLILALGVWFFNRMLIKPLHRLASGIDQLKNAPAEVREATGLNLPMPVVELDKVRRSFTEYHEKLAVLRRDLEKSSQDFFDQARHDALTGAYNRRAFDEDWRSLADSGYLGQCALLLFDCDHFKAINDSYGHGVGDAVIQAIAKSLTDALRTGDRLYRLGGDEFVTMLPNSDTHAAKSIAERCLHHVQCHDFRQYGLKEPVSISIGVALSDPAAFNLHTLHTRADLAMYSAKRPGNRKIVFFSEDLERMSSLVSNQRVNAVYDAMQNPELIELHYQPIVALPSGTPEYAEALARIRHEDGLLMPGAFLEIIQAHRLDIEFDLAVIRSLEGDIDTGRVPSGQGVSINISPPGVVDDRVLDALLALKRREAGRKIIVEITETALITQMAKATENIRRLRDLGCLVALDDFGSGYSSLRYLSSMPVDLVKFDISMIRLLIGDDPRQRLIVGEFANIVSANGYQIVAEGVETEEYLDRVVALGFNYAQGFYFG
jgi:diguanylate cyclase (GGDEF)-like protein